MRRFREPLAPLGPTGWMIGVMVTVGGRAPPLRHFYAVAQEDRAQAEWAAVDCAVALGDVASSPVGGLEPVQAVGPLSADKLNAYGVGEGQIRALGQKWPRSWLNR